mmetsp:Transcript_4842/g.3452  ORF Transcript_4842/g.3452 Transcript_4842/m.3452 type:complete len:80 (-) Transcript_4842:646-885(-)
MTIDDVCPYIIITDSVIPFNTNIEITLKEIQNAKVYLLQGESLTNIDEEVELVVDETVSVYSEDFMAIVVIPIEDEPFF